MPTGEGGSVPSILQGATQRTFIALVVAGEMVPAYSTLYRFGVPVDSFCGGVGHSAVHYPVHRQVSPWPL